ncbi:hypothetical protein LRAMOSA05601 [Lichtheimia ramosa]|uniref:Uncharacterized protein n=1 Tax=Lichtheimia ramosa TaxID=688394 RepID=A0A077X1P9_9FUNG|nr:hypothetical protein LRAMOSA05601 [Lichtheimia ramosa]
MSRPFVTVDYFSHQWEALDLGCASLELKRQLAETRRKLLCIQDQLDSQHDALRQWGLGTPSSKAFSSLSKEKNRLLSDEYRLCRLENVGWRQYAAQHGLKIDPIDINWQKNSDVIWLYGPLFRRYDNDIDFEKRLAGVSTMTHAIHHLDDNTKSLKPALKKRSETKEEYVEKLLGKSVSKRFKRRSFPVDHTTTMDFDMIEQQQHDGATSQKRTLRFKPDVLEYIYHADMPLRRNPSSRSKNKRNGGGKSSSAACQRAKALLLAARSNDSTTTTTTTSPLQTQSPPITLPPSPPLSPSSKEPSIQHNDVYEGGGWLWSFFSYSSHTTTTTTPPPSPPASPAPNMNTTTTSPPLESVPNLCANLLSLSAEMITLMGTAALYKGISYGLGCPTAQHQVVNSSSSYGANRSKAS